MILVVGATGLVGAEVCRKLAARGEAVRALVRSTSAKEKVDELRSLGVELCVGDLKDAGSLAAACAGVHAVISTASSTFSREAGDSIETVDAEGQLHLVEAAKAAGVDRFVFVSFRRPPGFSFPLADAKGAVEAAIAGMNFTVIQASFFMEAWLSPALGFDYVNGTARACGAGTGPVSWVSFRDVAEMCVVALGHPGAERRTIAFGGPEALSMLEVVGIFEKLGGRRFQVEHVPEEMLLAQFEGARDSLERSFAALMLGAASGDAMEMGPVMEEFGIRPLGVEEYARVVMAG